MSPGSHGIPFDLLNLQLLEEINMGSLRADIDNGMPIKCLFPSSLIPFGIFFYSIIDGVVNFPDGRMG